MGQRMKSTRPDFLTQADHTTVSLWQALTTTLNNCTRACPCRAQEALRQGTQRGKQGIAQGKPIDPS
ncbi:Vacuolar-sorting protein bro-1 [Gossypium arboreum]|uniref:Vacuolar-sorting protein bro-1 n=1 Tax=Gossypium arboreum TaxID=29729 RepID=A0A0B0NUU5_GOSAR|nr:Vacuolar-sorting protein bro-1 [Gossypium arboreum]